jgi:hypothetical protein
LGTQVQLAWVGGFYKVLTRAKHRAVTRLSLWASLGVVDRFVWAKALLWKGSYFQFTARLPRDGLLKYYIISQKLNSDLASLYLSVFLYIEMYGD